MASSMNSMHNGKRNWRTILQKIDNHESLAGTDLRNLYFSYTDFSGLDLRGANFKGCHMSYATMDGSDLSNADLTDANLIHASFKEANLTGAILLNSVVSGANFAQAKGLSRKTKKYLQSKGATGL
jgi:uncharacterized protein YjbI with pentapeptide repeats